MWIKLTKGEVREIRSMALSGLYTLREIAERFNISHANVLWIKQGHTWKKLWSDATTANVNAASVTANTEQVG